MVDHKHYTYRVSWSTEDDEFVGLCAEFPSLPYLAPSNEKVLKGILKLVAEVVSDMTTHKEEVPFQWLTDPSEVNFN